MFPPTPSTSNEFSSASDFSTFSHAVTDKIIDSMSLFVGGLEMMGPDAWDENKVAQVFGRYHGLQSVKLIRPGWFHFFLDH